MKTILLLFTLTLLAACGAEPLPNDMPAEQSQAAETYYYATDGIGSLPNSLTKFCMLTMFSNHNGAELSTWWPNGVFKNGALVMAADSTLYSKVYSSAAPPDRTSTAMARCHDFADYGFGPNAKRSTSSNNLHFLWNTSSGENMVFGDKGLWDTGNFCYLNGFDSMSDPNEDASVYWTAGTGRWWLTVAGYPKFGAYAKCVRPDRSFQRLGPYAVWNEGTAVGPEVANTVCGFSRFHGDMDNSFGYIYQESGHWKMLFEGPPAWYGDSSVEMRCARFQ